MRKYKLSTILLVVFSLLAGSPVMAETPTGTVSTPPQRDLPTGIASSATATAAKPPPEELVANHIDQLGDGTVAVTFTNGILVPFPASTLCTLPVGSHPQEQVVGGTTYKLAIERNSSTISIGSMSTQLDCPKPHWVVGQTWQGVTVAACPDPSKGLTAGFNEAAINTIAGMWADRSMAEPQIYSVRSLVGFVGALCDQGVENVKREVFMQAWNGKKKDLAAAFDKAGGEMDLVLTVQGGIQFVLVKTKDCSAGTCGVGTYNLYDSGVKPASKPKRVMACPKGQHKHAGSARSRQCHPIHEVTVYHRPAVIKQKARRKPLPRSSRTIRHDGGGSGIKEFFAPRMRCANCK